MNVPEVDWGNGRSSVWGYLGAVQLVAERLKDQSGRILSAIKVLFTAWKENRPVFIIGNGGSAGTASHFAADLAKTVISRPEERGFKVLSLVDNVPLSSAVTNDWGWNFLYDPMLRAHWETGGVLVAFSVHGGSGSDKAGAWSQNILRAVQFAKDNGGETIGFAGFDGGAMKELCDVCIVVPADSTPLVESFHVVLFHLITFELKAMIRACYEKEGR